MHVGATHKGKEQKHQKPLITAPNSKKPYASFENILSRCALPISVRRRHHWQATGMAVEIKNVKLPEIRVQTFRQLFRNFSPLITIPNSPDFDGKHKKYPTQRYQPLEPPPFYLSFSSTSSVSVTFFVRNKSLLRIKVGSRLGASSVNVTAAKMNDSVLCRAQRKSGISKYKCFWWQKNKKVS